VQLYPEYAEAYNNRGNAYLTLGDYDTAIADYTAAVQLYPEYAEAYGNRGVAYYAIGQYDAAIADFHEYERLTGGLESYMQDYIAEMEAALAEQNQGE
jgi:tetratricopeptide (TPR) repeat protein